MMRFKLDENLPAELAALIRAAGHDAHTVLEEGLGGASDGRVLEAGCTEQRILVTLDLDFADARAYPPEQTPGIMVLRLGRQDKAHIIATFELALKQLEREPIAHCLWIIEENRIRIRS